MAEGRAFDKEGRGPVMAWGTGGRASGVLGSQSAVGSRPQRPLQPGAQAAADPEGTDGQRSLLNRSDLPFVEDGRIVFI